MQRKEKREARLLLLRFYFFNLIFGDGEDARRVLSNNRLEMFLILFSHGEFAAHVFNSNSRTQVLGMWNTRAQKNAVKSTVDTFSRLQHLQLTTPFYQNRNN